MPFSPFFTKRPNWFHVRKPAAELAFGFLRSDEHDIVQTECELPDYVNWRKKSKAECISSRSSVNVMRAISRTLAICEMNSRVVEPCFAGDRFQHIELRGSSSDWSINSAVLMRIYSPGA
jgi:hypothetical protein